MAVGDADKQRVRSDAETAPASRSASDRRRHRRLDIPLAIECSLCGVEPVHRLRGTTSNISTGGLYFETETVLEAVTITPQSLLNLELTVPPGEGYYPYEGHVKGVIEVTRCEELARGRSGVSQQGRRIGVAGRFRKPLQLAF